MVTTLLKIVDEQQKKNNQIINKIHYNFYLKENIILKLNYQEKQELVELLYNKEGEMVIQLMKWYMGERE